MSTSESSNPLALIGPRGLAAFAMIFLSYGGYRVWQHYVWIGTEATVETAEYLCFHSYDSNSSNRAGSAAELLIAPATAACGDTAEMSRLKELGYNVVEPYWRLNVTYADGEGGQARATVTDWHRPKAATPYRPGDAVMIRHSPWAAESAELVQQ